MTGAPEPLNVLRHGDVINLEYAYVRAASAARQAGVWNEILANDPVFGPSSGCVVAVGPRMDGRRYLLIWVTQWP